MSWRALIGLSNCTRESAYSMAAWSESRAAPNRMPKRASFRQDSGPRSPWAWGSRAESGSRTLSRYSSEVIEARRDIFCLMSWVVKPGVPRGTRNPRTPSSVCAQTVAHGRPGDDGAPGAGGHRRGPPLRGQPLEDFLRREVRARGRLSGSGDQRGRCLHRGPGRHRAAAAAVARICARARRGDARRGRSERHPGTVNRTLVCQGGNARRTGQTGAARNARVPGGGPRHRLRPADRAGEQALRGVPHGRNRPRPLPSQRTCPGAGVIGSLPATNHQREFAAYCVDGTAEWALLDGAVALAWPGVDRGAPATAR